MKKEDYKNQSAIEAFNKIKLVEFELPVDFPVPFRDGCFIDKSDRTEDERTTKSGIYIPPTETNSAHKALLVAVGPDVPPYYKPGMMVLVNTNATMELLIGGKPYTPCSYFDLVGALPPKVIVIEDGLDQGQKRIECSLKRNAKALGHKIIE